MFPQFFPCNNSMAFLPGRTDIHNFLVYQLNSFLACQMLNFNLVHYDIPV